MTDSQFRVIFGFVNKLSTLAEIITRLTADQKRLGDDTLATAIGISKSHLRKVLGWDRAPRGLVLDYLGVNLVEMYEKKPKGEQ